MNNEKDKVGNITSVEADGNLAVKSDTTPYIAPFYFMEFFDEKAVKKFIKSTERLIRQSKEYSQYIEQLRESIHQLNHDNLLINISAADAPLEFHHFPFSLYDLVEICMTNMFQNKQDITTFKVAKEVMRWHYKHLVGLVSLTTTTHELAHNGDLFISKKQIFGDYQGFINLYSQSIPADLMLKVEEMEKMSEIQGVKSDFKGVL